MFAIAQVPQNRCIHLGPPCHPPLPGSKDLAGKESSNEFMSCNRFRICTINERVNELACCRSCSEYRALKSIWTETISEVPSPSTPVADVVKRLRTAPVDCWPVGWEKWDNVYRAHQQLLDERIRTLPHYPGGPLGRGIVSCVSARPGVTVGNKHLDHGYVPGAWIMVKELRRLGCHLPITFCHLGPQEWDEFLTKIFKPYGVNVVDLSEVARRDPMRILGGWESKVFAIQHAPYQEVLFLDADNFPLRDPAYLFDSTEYREQGALFWPEVRTRLRPRFLEAQAWHAMGMPHRKSIEEFESGQMLIDKSRCWKELLLTRWINEHSDWFYSFFYGDKNTFLASWAKLGRRYAMIPHRVYWNGASFIQHDFEGQRVFEHNVQNKPDLYRFPKPNSLTNRVGCQQHLKELQSLWSGRLGEKNQPKFKLKSEEAEATLLTQMYSFRSNGSHDSSIRFLPNGRIIRDARLSELHWDLVNAEEGAVLQIGESAGKANMLLRQDTQGTWRGGCGDKDQEFIALHPKTPSSRNVFFSSTAIRTTSRTEEQISLFTLDLPKHCFNPSLIRYRGKLLCAYRELVSPNENYIRLTQLNSRFQCEGKGRRLAIPGALSLPSSWEDPRLFQFQGRLFCSFTYWVASLGGSTTSVGICELNPKLEVIAVRYPRFGNNHNGCTGGKEGGQEKNWVFFEHQKDLYFIYQTIPFEVVAYDFDRDAIGRTCRSEPGLHWHWGPVRGGTPPVRVGDHFYSFFHSSLQTNGHWTYYAGLFSYTTSWPFRIMRLSPKPLLIGRTEPDCPKSVVFPGGAIFEKEWIVACGSNDVRCEIHRFGMPQLREHLAIRL